MVKLVKGKTVEAVFNMVPDSKSLPRSSRKSAMPSQQYKPKKRSGSSVFSPRSAGN